MRAARPSLSIRLIELRVLGAPRIAATNDRPVESLIHQTRRLALLVYLAAATPRGAHRRDKLLALFWPEADESRARAALNQALYVLRSRLGEVFAASGHDEVSIDPSALWCDAAEFEELLDDGRAEEALSLYRGDLLDGFHIADAPEFERWVDDERQRLRQRAADGAWALAEAHAAEGATVQAQRWARRAADLLPTDEAVMCRLMLFFRELGDRAAAIRAYESFTWKLAHEYELDPSAETRALAAAIRDEERSVPAPVLSEVNTNPRLSPTGQAPRRGWAWLLVVTAVAGAAGFATLLRIPPDETPPPARWVSMLDVDDVPPLSVGLRGTTIAISDEGDIVYVGGGAGGPRLFLKRRGQRRFAPIPGTEEAQNPEFSPDGEWIAWVVGNTIRKVRTTGGPSVEICRVDGTPHGVSWGDAGVIIVALRSGLYRVPDAGGRPELIGLGTPGSSEWFAWPSVLPGSRSTLLTIMSDSGFELGVMSLETGEVGRLGVPGSDPRFVPPSHLLWSRPDGSVRVARFDAKSGRVVGLPAVVAEDVHIGMGGSAFMGVSAAALAYVPFRSWNVLVLVDSLGREQGPPHRIAGVDQPQFTTDGRQLVLARRHVDSRLADISILDLDTWAMRPVTFDSGGFGPVVSSGLPLRIAYASKPAGRSEGFAIRLLRADSTTAADPLLPPEPNQRPQDFTPDDQFLLVQRKNPETAKFEIWIAALDGSGSIVPYRQAPANERGPALSPDGRWVAWSSDESGRYEIHAGEFPVLRDAVQVSEGGGIEPRWDRTGALHFRTDRGMMRMRIASEAPLQFTAPRVLFDDRRVDGLSRVLSYDVNPDGSLFALIRPGADDGDLLLRHGWIEELRAAQAPR